MGWSMSAGGYIVIFGGDGQIRTADLPACHSQTLKGLRGSYFVNEMQVDVEQVFVAAVLTVLDYMSLPDLLAQS